MLILSILFYIYTALIVGKWVFKELTVGKFLISFYLAAYSVNILIFEILAVFHRLNDKSLFILAQVILCSLIVLILRFAGGESLKPSLAFQLKKWRAWEYVFFTCMAIIMGAFFFVGINTSPNNLDSLATHILRIYYWLQHGSLESWPASTHFQLYYPVNAHFQGTWLFLLGGSEKLFFLVQWFSYLIILVLTYEISIFLGSRRVVAMFSALVCLGLPVALLQMYSFQGDLTVAALILAGIYFLYTYRYTVESPLLFAALLSLTLAFGTKQTAYFAFPVLIGFGFYWLKNTELKNKRWVVITVTIAMIGLFAVNKNILNIQETGKVFGKVTPYIYKEDPLGNGAKSFFHNTPRYIYSLISFDGLPLDIHTNLAGIKAALGKEIDTRLNLQMEDGRFLPPGYDGNEAFAFDFIPPLSEDTSWIGLVGFLIIPAGIGLSLFSKEKRIRDYAVFSLVFGVVYALSIILQRPGWDPYQGRYFIMGLIPAIPLVAGLVPKRKPFGALVMSAISILVIGIALNTLLFNESKPVLSKYELSLGLNRGLDNVPPTNWVNRKIRGAMGIGLGYLNEIAPEDESIFTKSWLQQVYNSNQSTIKKVIFIDGLIPQGENVSLYKPSYTLEYGLFGENVSRKLFPLKSLEDFKAGSFLITQSEIKDPNSYGLFLVGKSGRIFIYR